MEDAADEGLEGVVAVLQPGRRWQKRQRRQRGLGGVATAVDASAAGSVTLEVPLAPAAAASEVVDVAELPLPPPSLEPDGDLAGWACGGGVSSALEQDGQTPPAKLPRRRVCRTPTCEAEGDPEAGRQHHHQLEAPASLEEAFSWPARYCQVLPPEAKNIMSRLAAGCKHGGGLWLSTHYSGVGCSETMADEILTEFCRPASATESRSAQQKRMHVYHACDIDPVCLNALQSHTAPTAAAHLFIDIKSRYPPQAIQELERLLKTLQKGHARATAKQRRELGEQFQSAASSILQKHGLSEEAFCIRHRRKCPIYDVDGKRVRRHGGIIGNMSGPTCTDYSVQNHEHPQGLGASNLVWACWGEERRARAANFQEDWIFHECVPGLPASQRLHELCPDHALFSWVLDPTQFGVPIHRRRRYTLAVAPWLMSTMLPVRRPITAGADDVMDIPSDGEEAASAALKKPMSTMGGPVAWFGCRSPLALTGSTFFQPRRIRLGATRHSSAAAKEPFVSRGPVRSLWF